MITSQEFNHYTQESTQRNASRWFFQRWFDRFMWLVFRRHWCPRCQKTFQWSYSKEGPLVSKWIPGEKEGKGEWGYAKRVDYEKMTCKCGLSLILISGELYDINIEDH